MLRYETIELGQDMMKRRYDQPHHDRVHFEASEVVVMLRQPVPGQSTKLQSKYRERSMRVIKSYSRTHIVWLN